MFQHHQTRDDADFKGNYSKRYRMATSLTLRAATESDLADMANCYAFHVLKGTGSFEEEPPSPDEMRARWRQREQGNHPTLIAHINNLFAGFAYAGPHKARSAYRYTVEDSIYVLPDFAGCGVGTALLNALIEICTELGYKQMMAVIGDSNNQGSIALHARCGFRHIGTAEAVGFKYGQWLDVVFMQRGLA